MTVSWPHSALISPWDPDSLVSPLAEAHQAPALGRKLWLLPAYQDTQTYRVLTAPRASLAPLPPTTCTMRPIILQETEHLYPIEQTLSRGGGTSKNTHLSSTTRAKPLDRHPLSVTVSTKEQIPSVPQRTNFRLSPKPQRALAKPHMQMGKTDLPLGNPPLNKKEASDLQTSRF